MQQAWTSKYRPTKFSDVVGQKPVRAVLTAMVRKDQIPSGMLFSGPYGSGKTSTARILAAALNCEREDKPCGECASCTEVFAGTSLDVIEIDAASNGGVLEIRKLTEFLSYSTSGRYRVVLLDEVQSMSRTAYDALLKTLEEPPPNTVFVLLTTEPARVAKTILSRLTTFQFDKITTGDIEGQLRKIVLAEAVVVSDEILRLIAHSAQGSLRDAVKKLDQVVKAEIETEEAYRELYSEYDFAPELIGLMLAGDASGALSLIDSELARVGDPAQLSSQLLECFTDILKLGGGGSVYSVGDSLQARLRLIPMLSTEKVIMALKVIWDLKTKVRANEDGRALLEVMVVVIMDVIKDKTHAVVPNVPSAPAIEAPRKLGIADLRAQK